MTFRPRPRHSRSTTALLLVTTLLTATGVGGVRAGTGEPTAAATSVRTVTPACVSGWLQGQFNSTHGAALDSIWAGPTPWIVGFDDGTPPAVRGFAARWTGSRWESTPLPLPKGFTFLTAISRAVGGQLWAAGFAQGAGITTPVIFRWDGIRWTRQAVAAPQVGAVLTGITRVGKTGTGLAVGYTADATGQRPFALMWTGTRWVRADLGTLGIGALTGVASAPDGTAWAVGWTHDKRGVHPLLARWKHGAWVTATLDLGGLALSAVTVGSATDAWAVGFQDLDQPRPVALHWNGTQWDRDADYPDARPAVFLGVAQTRAGTIAVGTGISSGRLQPLLATLDPPSDLVESIGSMDKGSLMTAAAGPKTMLAGTGAGRLVVTSTSCPGSSPKAGGLPAAGNEAAPMGTRQTTPPIQARRSASSGTGVSRPSSSTHERPTRQIVATDAGALAITDVTDAAGVSFDGQTYDVLADDLDLDGWSDLVLSVHGAPPGLFLNNRDGTFRRLPVGGFPQRDRHGCASGSVDTDPEPELFCVIGSTRGTSLKENELWLDPLAEDPGAMADAGGLADPLGRGRTAALFDFDSDGLTDAYVSNEATRPDGLPDTNRLFRNSGGTFTPSPAAGLDLGIGGSHLLPADINGDGWTDLVICEEIAVAQHAAVRVFINDRGKFSDATAALGLPSTVATDAAVGDLDGDGHLDLVLLTPQAIKFYRGGETGFTLAFSQTLWDSRSIAIGDLDGDGSPDVYVVAGSDDGNPVADQLLLNRGDLQFELQAVPFQHAGPGGPVAVLDFDGDGRDDVFALHGNQNVAGPVQLLRFSAPV